MATALTRLVYAPQGSPCPCMRRGTGTVCIHLRTSSCSVHDDATRGTPCPSFPKRCCTSNSGRRRQDRQAERLIRNGSTPSVELHTPPRRAASMAVGPSWQADPTNPHPQKKTSHFGASYMGLARPCIAVTPTLLQTNSQLARMRGTALLHR